MIKATSLHFLASALPPLPCTSPFACRHMESICMGSILTFVTVRTARGGCALHARDTSLSGTAESQRYAGAASAQTAVLSGDFIRYNNETRYDEPALA